MVLIRLPGGKWEYDPLARLGDRGGFGEVFAGTGENHGPVAIKRLRLEANQAAHRELRIASEVLGRSLEHVVPTLDSGRDANSGAIFVVMPLAEKSLQQEVDRIGIFTDVEAIRTLLDIALGLAEVPEITHRDLKPANVLYHAGRWKIADFGIARFVEESTSLMTLKDCLTPAYAAPEQWLMERVASATDIYALGCIAYVLTTGQPPFRGPSRADYREQHLGASPPALALVDPRLISLSAMMLRKEPSSRPRIGRVIELLENMATRVEVHKPLSGGFSALQRVGVVDAEAALATEAARRRYQGEQDRRSWLAGSALETLEKLAEDLFDRIESVAPTARRSDDQFGFPRRLQIGDADIKIEPLNGGMAISDEAFQRSRWDVVAGATIAVTQRAARPYVWGANLWYTDLGRDEDFRWWEVPYMSSPLVRKSAKYEPFALTDLSEADRAAGEAMHVITFAREPRPVDDENVDDFCDRWAELLARAYNGKLRKPTNLPMK